MFAANQRHFEQFDLTIHVQRITADLKFARPAVQTDSETVGNVASVFDRMDGGPKGLFHWDLRRGFRVYDNGHVFLSVKGLAAGL